jgi:pimeloyl-ACP methyl ester carboxylesterase
MSLFSACQKEETEDKPTAKARTTDTVLSADGVSVRYDVRGAGEKALVFVHCWCCDRSYWFNQVDEFSEKYKVVTIDLAGHGESGLDREQWTVEAYADDVAAVVNKLELQELILIGHSMGAMVIIEAANRLTDRVTALIGVDNYINFDRAFDEDRADEFLQNFRDDFSGFTYTYVNYIFGPNADSELVATVSNDMSGAPPEIGIGSMESLIRFSYPSALGKLNIPVRGINGDLSPTNFEGNRNVYADFDAVIIDSTGHFPHLERPEQFNQILTEMIDGFWAGK